MSRRTSLKTVTRRLSRRLVEHYLLILLALVSSAAVLLLYYIAHGTSADLWPNIAAELIATPLIFVIVYVFVILPGVSLPRMAEGSDTGALVEFYRTHEIVDWAAVISAARRLDVIVHYYDAWVRDYDTELTRLFERGGSVRFVLPDPKLPNVMATVQREFFPRHSVDRLLDKVKDTAKHLEEAYERAGSKKASLEVFAFPGTLHYAAVIADERHVFLSVYEQFRGTTIRSQVFHMDLAKDAELGDYWRTTVSDFIAKSTPFKSE